MQLANTVTNTMPPLKRQPETLGQNLLHREEENDLATVKSVRDGLPRLGEPSHTRGGGSQSPPPAHEKLDDAK